MNSNCEMRGKLYETLGPLLAILTSSGKRVIITIPQGAVIRVIQGPLDGSCLVDAKWEDKAVKMYLADLRERSIMVSQQ